MNRSDAQVIVDALRGFSLERKLVVITALRWNDNKQPWPLMTKEESSAFFTIHDKTTTDPWMNGDDTFDEVVEALETDMVGECDCCGQYSALRNGEAAGSEASMCKWGCKP